MIETVAFRRAVPLSQRQATRILPDDEIRQLVGAWRRDRLADEDLFRRYLDAWGATEADLAACLSADGWDPVEGATDWERRWNQIHCHLSEPVRVTDVRFGPQLLAELPFEPFFRSYLGWLSDALPAEAGCGSLLDSLLRGASARLAEVALPCLVEEWKRSGLAYPAYCLTLLSPTGRQRLAQHYPVLVRHCTLAVLGFADQAREVCSALQRERGSLRRLGLLPNEQARLTAIECDRGDRHAGRAVWCLRFEDGRRLIYRPRGGAGFLLYRAVVEGVGWWGPALRAPRCLVAPDHAWIEYVDATTPARLSDFYRRLGAAAASAWVLGSRDLHFENVIATRDGPVPIDLETVTSAAVRSDGGSAAARAAQRLNRSPLGTGYFPVATTLSASDRRQLEVSVLTGGLTPTEAEIRLLVGVADGSPRFASQRVDTGRQLNLPRADLTVDDVRENLPCIEQGFSEMAETLGSARAELLAVLGSSALESQPIRILLRPTRLYSLLLKEASHPAYLQSALAQQHLFDRLWSGPGDPGIGVQAVRAEVDDLVERDIPYFEAEFASDVVRSHDGRSVALLESSCREVIGHNLGVLTPDCVGANLGLAIEGAIASLTRTPAAEPAQPRVDRGSSAFQPPACAAPLHGLVLDTFLAEAVLGEDDADWLGFSARPGSDVYEVRPVGHSLFDGAAGIGLALAAASEIAPTSGARQLAVRALNASCAFLRGWNRDPSGPSGALAGAAGHAYALVTFATTFPDQACSDRFVATAREAAHRLVSEVERDRYLDVTSGAAGALAVGCYLAEVGVLGCAEFEKVAHAATARLLDGPEVIRDPRTGALSWRLGDAPALGGFSHGASGIGWALARAAERLDDDGLRAAARDALSFDDSLYCDEVGLWRDARSEDPLYPVHWCHGAAGIVLARSGHGEQSPADEAVDLLGRWLPSSDCLCHGTLGNWLIMNELDRSGARSAGFLADALSRITQDTFRPGLGMPVRSVPGLMIGQAGLLYALSVSLGSSFRGVLRLG